MQFNVTAGANTPVRQPNDFVRETARLLEARNILTEAMDVANHVAAILTGIGATSADSLLVATNDSEFENWFAPVTMRNRLQEEALRRFLTAHANRKLGGATSATLAQGNYIYV